MQTFGSVQELLDFAIQREEQAVVFYQQLARLAGRPEKQEVFKAFAKEEEGHKAKLLAMKEGKVPQPTPQAVQDLKVGDYLVPEETSPDMSYQQALVTAMTREKTAFRLYTDLAAKTQDAGLRTVLQTLAMEEARHKLRFEIEYDEMVLKEN
jgi:rubrerythrin